MSNANIQGRWDRRVQWAAGNILCYVENRDVVSCKNHGAENTYSLVYQCWPPEWKRVCDKCVADFFGHVKMAIKSEEAPLVDVCFHEGCMNDAIPSNHCAWCQERFCVVHMTDSICCEDCVAKADEEYGANHRP